MRQPLTAVIITLNEEKNLPRCLASLVWVDEVLVIDSFSADGTAAIAEERGARVIRNDFPGYTRQYEFGVSQATHAWVLVVDADEEVTPALRDSILSVLAEENPPIRGYDVKRHVRFLGRWIDHSGWYPDLQFRFFRKDEIRFVHQEVHGGIVPTGRRATLQGDLNHYTYNTLFEYLNTINRFTSLHVSDKLKDPRTRRIRWYNLVLNPLSYFLRMFLIHRGYKDGFPGFILAIFSSFYTLSLHAKLWEYQMSETARLPLPPITTRDLKELDRRNLTLE